MAKRQRGSRSAHRPGGYGPTRAPRSATGTRPADAAGIAAVPAASPAAASPARPSTPSPAVAASASRSTPPKARVRTRQRGDTLAARVAAEESWISDDLRRIAIISGALVLSLLLAWFLLVVLNLSGLY